MKLYQQDISLKLCFSYTKIRSQDPGVENMESRGFIVQSGEQMNVWFFCCGENTKTPARSCFVLCSLTSGFQSGGSGKRRLQVCSQRETWSFCLLCWFEELWLFFSPDVLCHFHQQTQTVDGGEVVVSGASETSRNLFLVQRGFPAEGTTDGS